MSLSKYMQLYKKKGFFLGSIIRVTVSDVSFLGSELILMKGSKILESKTITDTITDFFTDESGNLTVTVDNGSKILNGTATVSAYGTYNVILSSSASTASREIYPNATDVLLFVGDTSKDVSFAYTGDKSTTSVVSSDTSVATASIRDNVVTINRASGDTEATCTVTATVAATDEYPQKSVNFNVKRYGSVGDWATASDETIANMVAAADRGEINLRDYWNIGDTRQVTLGEITRESGSVMLAQPQQTIELVLMHNAIVDNQYVLTTPTASNRTRPSYVVGMKNCLQNLSPLDFVSGSKSETVSNSSESFTATLNYKTLNIDSWLNNKFFNALPSTLRDIFKNVNVKCVKTGMDSWNNGYSLASVYNVAGTKSQKVSLPSIYEITGATVTLETYSSGTYWFRFRVNGLDAYKIANTNGGQSGVDSYSKVPNDSWNLAYEGSFLDYYKNNYKNNTVKTRGNNEAVDYYTRTDMDMMIVFIRNDNAKYQPKIRSLGVKTSRTPNSRFDANDVTSFDKDDYASTYFGISPILYI